MTFRLSICCKDPDLKGLVLGELKYLLCAATFDRLAGLGSSDAHAERRFSPPALPKKGEWAEGAGCEGTDCVEDWKADCDCDWDCDWAWVGSWDGLRLEAEAKDWRTEACRWCERGLDEAFRGLWDEGFKG